MEYDALMRDVDLPAAHLAAARAAPTARRSTGRGCGPERWRQAATTPVPADSIPLRHGLAFLISGGTAFNVDAPC